MITTIRSVDKNNSYEVAELFVQVFNTEPWNENWEINNAEKRIKSIVYNENFIGAGLYEENGLIGFIGGLKEQWCDCDYFYIMEFFVKPEKQKKGNGKKLLNFLEQRLKEIGIKKTYLLTMKNSDSENFYKVNNYYSSEKMVLMGKWL